MPSEANKWRYAENLRTIRKRSDTRSVEKAAQRIPVSRATWNAWENGAVPTYDNLRRIVEAFRCPPEMVGFEPPEGWELVPAQWIIDRSEAIQHSVDDVLALLSGVLARRSREEYEREQRARIEEEISAKARKRNTTKG